MREVGYYYVGSAHRGSTDRLIFERNGKRIFVLIEETPT